MSDTRTSPLRIAGGGPLVHEPAYRLGRMMGAMENIVRLLNLPGAGRSKLAAIRKAAEEALAQEHELADAVFREVER